MKSLLNTIKNNQQVLKSKIYVPNSKFIRSLLNLLWNENLIAGYSVIKKEFSFIIIYLKYKKKKPILVKLKSISKPGKKVYLKSNQLWKVNDNSGILIISTNKGLLTLDSCKKFNLGGEPLYLIN